MKKILLCLLGINILACHAGAQTDPAINFMVFSDPHYYAPELGTSGKAFDDYLNEDRKLLRESDELLKEACTHIEESSATFVLIPGDLTKDGTKISHIKFASYLAQIEAAGKQVYVVPGNHDVRNGEAMSYKGDSAIRVDNISPSDFTSIYGQYGYNQALERDQASLSYLAEPVPGTWILALDACRYGENSEQGHPITEGKFSPETLVWIREVLEKAANENIQVIAMMHHGVVEHYRGQEKYYGEYLVDDYPKIGKLLAENGVRIVFTGHYHAQDITMHNYDSRNFLIDVETGSLVTYPCPVRTIKMDKSTVTVTTWTVQSISSHPDDFREFAREYVIEGIAGIAEKTLVNMHLKPEDAAKLSRQIGLAFCAHYEGDENADDKMLDMKGVSLFGRVIISFRKRLIKGLYTDLEPGDNNVEINLEDGSWKALPGSN